MKIKKNNREKLKVNEMKKLIIFIVMFIALNSLAQEKQKVAIYTTDDSGENIVEFVGEFLTDAIVKRGTYIAVERTAQFLRELNKEQAYQRSGSVDDNEISRLGKQMGVHLVCVVKIGKGGDQLFISARLIDVESATLQSTARPVRFSIDDWDGIEKSCEAVTTSMFGEKGSSLHGSRTNSSNTTNSNSDFVEMVFVEGGTFIMGCTYEQGSDCYDDEKPNHQVTVSDFYIGKYEVTQRQWEEIMGTSVRQQRDKADASYPIRGEGSNYPMYYVSWHDVQEFITRLNARTGLHYRLPTEAEWEYAARGGSKSKGYKYSGSNILMEVAWCKDNSGETTHPVGTKQPNELGIYDMSGNVLEWCLDWYGNYSSVNQTDPSGSSSGTYRVNRGGSWGNFARNVRVSNRLNSTPSNRGIDMGFRLVRSSR